MNPFEIGLGEREGGKEEGREEITIRVGVGITINSDSLTALRLRLRRLRQTESKGASSRAAKPESLESTLAPNVPESQFRASPHFLWRLCLEFTQPIH